jgi:hypothetical protein
MLPQITSVTFSVTVHASGDRFSVPVKVSTALDLTDDQDSIQLWIHSSSGSFSVITKMMSGPEIYGPEIKGRLQAGERLLVEASMPPVSN